MTTPELPSPMSYEELALREEVQTIINQHFRSGDFAILQANDLIQPANILFGGRTRGNSKRLLDVKMSVCLYDNNQQAVNITLDDSEYVMEQDGVYCASDPDNWLGEDELVNMRFWLAQTQWQPVCTQLFAERIIGQG
jgi:hypothetical protein